MGKNNILPYPFAEKLIPMVKFRNRLVHLYWEVSREEVFKIIQNNLKDIEDFAKHIATFLEKKS